MKDREYCRKEEIIPAVYIKEDKTDEHTMEIMKDVMKWFTRNKCDVLIQKENQDPYESNFHVDDSEVESCAIISPCKCPYVNGRPEPDDKEAIREFEKKLICYTTNRFRILHEFGGEDLFFIRDISLGESMSLACDFGQYTFIYKDINGCREICSEPFEGYGGSKLKSELVYGDDGEHFDLDYKYEYQIGDVVKDYSWYYLDTLRDFAEIIVKKRKAAEIIGREKENRYEPKNWYELYMIRDAYPTSKPPAPIRSYVRSMQLITRREEG